MPDLDHIFQRLCHEAVVACGADIAAIERYVFERIDKMNEVDQARVRRDLAIALAFRPAPAETGGSH